MAVHHGEAGGWADDRTRHQISRPHPIFAKHPVWQNASGRQTSIADTIKPQRSTKTPTVRVNGVRHKIGGMHMTTQDYERLIMEGIKGLPPEILAEIADFIYFVRKRALQPQTLKKRCRTPL